MLHDNHAVHVRYGGKLTLSKGHQTEPKYDKYNYSDVKPFAHGLVLSNAAGSRE